MLPPEEPRLGQCLLDANGSAFFSTELAPSFQVFREKKLSYLCFFVAVKAMKTNHESVRDTLLEMNHSVFTPIQYWTNSPCNNDCLLDQATKSPTEYFYFITVGILKSAVKKLLLENGCARFHPTCSFPPAFIIFTFTEVHSWVGIFGPEAVEGLMNPFKMSLPIKYFVFAHYQTYQNKRTTSIL